MRNELSLHRKVWRRLALAGVTAAGLAGIVGSGPSFMPDCLLCPEPQNWISVRIEGPAAVQVGEAATFTAFVSASPTLPYCCVASWCRSAGAGGNCVAIPAATDYAYTLPGANLSDDGAVFAITVRSADVLDTSGTVGTAQITLHVSNTPPVVFQDGEFLPEDWSAEAVARPPQEPALAHDEERVESGGNPGAFRRTVQEMPMGAWRDMWVFNLSRTAVYEPVAQGALYGVDFDWDVVRLSPALADASGVYLVPLIEQGGRRFVSMALACNYDRVSGWQPSSACIDGERVARAPEGTFDWVDGPACDSGTTCLDFSAGAPALRFGYALFANWPDGRPAASLVQGLDNWKVTAWRR
jgi:hypothetical protein